jgi:hypothetical protein
MFNVYEFPLVVIIQPMSASMNVRFDVCLLRQMSASPEFHWQFES